MDIWVLDRDLSNCGVFDSYESFIWTERYNKAGDFELIMPISKDIVNLLQEDRYLFCELSNKLMIVETIETTSDIEEGDKIKVTGRSLESYLDRRVIWGYKKFTGELHTCIHELINENAINPENSNRQIPKLAILSTTDSRITSKTVDLEFFGDNLYDSIKNICVDHDVGFQIIPDYDSSQLMFNLYFGDDHSYAQNANAWVIFSPEYENLLTMRMLKSKTAYKTVSMVGGSGENYERKIVEASLSSDTGYDRREMYTDASSISQTDGDTVYTDQEYESMLNDAGKLELSEYKITKAFDGSVEPKRQFIYGRDFKLGDIVQVSDEYGQETKARVSEVMFSDDTNGLLITPSFTFSEDL